VSFEEFCRKLQGHIVNGDTCRIKTSSSAFKIAKQFINRIDIFNKISIDIEGREATHNTAILALSADKIPNNGISFDLSYVIATSVPISKKLEKYVVKIMKEIEKKLSEKIHDAEIDTVYTGETIDIAVMASDVGKAKDAEDLINIVERMRRRLIRYADLARRIAREIINRYKAKV